MYTCTLIVMIYSQLWAVYKAVARGGVPQVHVHPPLKKTKKKQTKNYFLCRIIRFYTNNPKCQYVYLSLRASRGLCPLAPLPGLCPGPTGGLKRPPDPSPNNFAPPPPFLIPGYGPVLIRLFKSWPILLSLLMQISLNHLFLMSMQV